METDTSLFKSFFFGFSLQVLCIVPSPKFLNMLKSIFIHRLFVSTTTVSKAPFKMIINGQTTFHQHLCGTINSYDDQNPFSVTQRSSSRLRNHNVYVDEDIS